MNDERRPSREGGARLRARDGRGVGRRLVRALVFVAGLAAMASRSAADVVVDAIPLSPLMRRVSAVGAFALELAADPAQALAPIAVIATVSVSIAAWRRSAAAGTAVAGTMAALLDSAGDWL